VIQFRRFITALAVLLVAFGLYSFLAAPWFEPPPIARKTGTVEPMIVATHVRRERDFAPLFEPGSWELENPKVVENPDCTLLIQDYKPLDDGRMELRPCTLIFYSAPDEPDPKAPLLPDGSKPLPKRRPIVMRAPQGAILQFDRPLDLGKAQFGRVIGGRLAGEITIFSPESKPGANDALRLQTRNVQIDTERAFTPHDVEFSYGNSYGRGRDMTIFLLPNENSTGGKSSTPIGGVRALQLSHVEKLHLEMDGPSLVPDLPNADGKPAVASAPGKPSPPLEVRCKGPLVYDFEQKIIAVDDQVELTRVYPNGPPDRLLCSKLMLYLAPPAGEAVPVEDKLALPAATIALPQSADQAMASKLFRVVAVGSPVVLEAPSSSTFVVASRIEYSPPKRRLSLESGDGAKQVVLEREQDRFEARTLEAEMAADGQRLGRLWAAGPGRLRLTHTQDGKPETIAAQWEKELRIRPHEKNQVISLVRSAAIDIGGNGTFAADEMHIWVLEVSPDDARAGGSTANKSGKSAIVPDRMLAVGHVQVDSPQLRAETGRLEAWFVDAPLPPEQKSGAIGSVLPVSPQNAPLRPPIAGAPPTVAGATPPQEPIQQFKVTGELVQMQIARDGQRTALEDLTIQGGVEIVETPAAPSAESPLRIKGDALQLRDGASDNAKLEVRGKPAEVSARGLTMSGPSIHLHRGENRLWIDGPGKATLPVPSDKKSIQPPPMEAEKMNVFWQKSMNFDGSTAVLVGEVQATSATQRALSETLEVTLAQPVDFANPQSHGATDVARLRFDGGVDLENTTLDPLGERTSVEQLQVRNLLIDRRTGALKADGPGWLTSIRKGGAEALAKGPNGQPAAVPLPAADAGALTHMHIEFKGGITGDVNRHDVTFQEQVKTIYASVQDWDTRITMQDVDRGGLTVLGEKGALLSSDQLTVREMTPPVAQFGAQKWIEMEAIGSTMVEGKSFTARGDRISYTTDKEQLVLQGDGRNDAELWHQQVKGGQYSYTAATKIMYWRGKNEVVFEGGKVLDLQQLGKPPPSPLQRLR
jgi:hypothetical protein